MSETLILQFEGVGPAEYDAVNAKLGIDMTTGRGDWPEGLISHSGGTADDGRFVVTEVWESRAAQAAFMTARLGSALADGGITSAPTVTWVVNLAYHPLGAEARNRASVESIYAAFGRGDIPYILDQLDPSVAWEHELPDYGVPYLVKGTGPDHVAKFFASLDTLDFEHFEPLNITSGGDQVVAIVRVQTRTKATNRRVQDYEGHVWTFGADGRVVKFDHLLDRYGHAAAHRGTDG